VNVDDQNNVRGILDQALSGKPVLLDNPRIPASELLTYAEELKQEDPRYRNLRVTQAGPNCIAVELEQVQSPHFRFERPRVSITISARDAKRLATVLEAQSSPDARSAAVKIRSAMQLGDATRVELAIGEDTAVILALEELQHSGDFGGALSRLLRELKTKTEGENVRNTGVETLKRLLRRG
jgi:SepF-like predicted cell division protein (DUF552 family)